MLVFLLILIAFVSIYAWNKPEIQRLFVFNAYKTYHAKEYYRLLTSGFVHANWLHLGFNLYVLYLFGEIVLRDFSLQLDFLYPDFAFLLLFVLGVIVSELPSFLKYKNQPVYNSLGASGGVSSVVFASILLHPTGLKMGLLFIPIYLPAFMFGILYLIYSHYQSKNAQDNINHDAHLYGALFGLVFVIMLYPEAVPHFIEELKNWDGDIFSSGF